MADLKEFHLFPKLPKEIRYMIWEAVPRPQRIVAAVPPRRTWYINNLGRNNCEQLLGKWDGKTKPEWALRYVVQPREATIFAPLHVNREARKVWAPCFTRIENREAEAVYGDRQGIVRFDVPFIDYETDIFTAVDVWIPYLYFSLQGDLGPLRNYSQGHSYSDSFPSLDRAKIKHIGIFEQPLQEHLMVLAIDINRLPKLESMTIVSLGPDTRVYETEEPQGDAWRRAELMKSYKYKFPYQQMPGVDIQCVDCELSDLDKSVVDDHPFFNVLRLQHPGFFESEAHKLKYYPVIFKAWLWHMNVADTGANYEMDSEHSVNTWMHLLAHLLNQPGARPICPLPVTSCMMNAHTREEVTEWEPPFEIKHKFLCPKEWVEELEEMEVLTNGPSYLD